MICKEQSKILVGRKKSIKCCRGGATGRVLGENQRERTGGEVMGTSVYYFGARIGGGFCHTLWVELSGGSSDIWSADDCMAFVCRAVPE